MTTSADTQGDHDLRVLPQDGENLRTEASGSIVARLSRGALLDELNQQGNWIQVRRIGWMWSRSLRLWQVSSITISAAARQYIEFDFVDTTHPGPQNVGDMTALKFFDSISADHSPVGNNAKAVDAKSLSDSIRYRDQRFNISRIAGPHFAADGPALIVDNGSDNHLVQIRPVVFAKSPLTNAFTTATLEVD